MKRRKHRRKALGIRAPASFEPRPNARWSMDFIHDQMANGRRFRILNIVDDFTHECLGSIPDVSISGVRVARELSAIVSRHGKPKTIISDNGTELTSNAVLAWSTETGVEWHYIAPGKPTQNAYVESFNGRMRDELLNETLFFGLPDARATIAGWVEDYNNTRPHSSLNYSTPAAFAAQFNASGLRAALPDGSALRPLASPAPQGVTKPPTLIAAG